MAGVLQFTGMKGVGITDDSVWLAKSHYPMYFPTNNKEFGINRCVSITRNPFDCVVSVFNLINTFTHDKVLQKDFFQEEYWTKFCLELVRLYKGWHEILIKESRENKIPVIFIRFEDLLNEPEQYLSEAFAFALGVKSIDGLNI